MKLLKKEQVFNICYILPSFLLLIVFNILPIFMDIFFSFTKYNIIQPPTFVGVKNYIRLLQDPYVVTSLKNTVIFTALTVPGQTILSLLFASLIALYFKNKYGSFLRSAMFIPVIASTVLIGTLWSIILAPNGVVNNVLFALCGKKFNWLGSKELSLLSVAMATIWKNVGYFLVIYYAGILDIPSSYYEAAEVDGANKIQQFIYITVPNLKPITYLVVTLSTIWSFQVFDMVYTMTGGGPGLSTVTLVLTIYNAAFKEYNMGYASAIALLMFFFVLIISRIQKIFLKGEKNE